MSHRIRSFLLATIVTALLATVTVAQRPPAAPPPPPPSAPPGRSTNSTPLNPGSTTQPNEDLVMFLRGRVATNDGTPLPNNVLVERVCNNRVRQEVYASLHGDFSMQLGSKTDSLAGPSAEPVSPYGVADKNSDMG